MLLTYLERIKDSLRRDLSKRSSENSFSEEL